MPNTSMTFEVDEDLRYSFESIADELGIGAAGAMTVMMRAFVRSKGMPFPMTLDRTPEEIEEDRFYSHAHMAELERRIDEAKRGESLIAFNSVEELHRYADEYAKRTSQVV